MPYLTIEISFTSLYGEGLLEKKSSRMNYASFSEEGSVVLTDFAIKR